MASLVSNFVDKAKSKISALQPQQGAPLSAEDQSVSEKAISRVCPNCRGCTLTFVPSDKFVTCPACDQSISTDELVDSHATQSDAANASPELEAMLGMIASIDSPEAGLIYLENFFANYNWSFYKQSSALFISEIASMVEKNKIKQGATPQAWLLDFQSIAYPISMKMEGLSELEQAIAAEYNGLDSTNILALFDRYKTIVNALFANRASILKRLNNDVDFAEKLGLPADELSVMKQQKDAVTKAFDALVAYEKATDIPAVADAKKKIDEQKIREFKARGIDVVDVYRRALDLYNLDTPDKREALRLFESIRGYSDTVDYIQKINLYFGYYGKFYHFFGNDYLFRTHKKALLFNPADAGKGCGAKKKNQAVATEEIPEEESFEGKALDLFPVVDKEPAEEPIIKGITNIITYYGSRLFYIKLKKYFCSYDMVSRVETTLCTCAESDKEYLFFASEKNNTLFFNPTGSAVYVRRRLPLTIERTGCFKKALGQPDVVDSRMNNFSLVKVDFAENAASTIIDEIVDIVETRGNYMFYTVSDGAEKDSEKITLMTYDMATGETKPLLSESCEIEAISGTKVAYTTYEPNSLNKNLFVYDIITGDEKLIEKNIYSFFRFIEDRVYYFIGNDDHCPLFSNTTDGTDRVEILTNVENIFAVSAGWMYVLRSLKTGRSYNNVLLKISLDGKKRLVICSQLKSIIKQTELYIYYLDSWNTLHVVRTDGKENTIITTDIDATSISVDDNCIYFLREEQVTLASQNNRSTSLYAMDLDGHNLRKILFSVISFKNFDENTLYVEKTNQIRYNIFYPAPRKKDERSEVKTFTYTSFYRYDKNSGALDNFLNINFPHPSKYEASGCFGKKHDMESVFTEIPIKSQQGYRGIAPGAIREEQIAERNALGLNKAGCAAAISGLFKKDKETPVNPEEPIQPTVKAPKKKQSTDGKERYLALTKSDDYARFADDEKLKELDKDFQEEMAKENPDDDILFFTAMQAEDRLNELKKNG